MERAVVTFDHVWKKFRIGERHNSLRDLAPALARRLVGRMPKQEMLSTEEFWALRDIDFEVRPGEALGIIGPNGAGKSTTLKLLTRILRPTKGRCEVRGRVGALIEVAAGFHGDLTGRENIYLQGAVMGMTRVEISRHLEQIIEFAGVGQFIDTQVKRYSSGMNARLGFSIAAHLNPDVLIIDEVLAVGDITFQERCIRRMEEFKRNGVAIVFVSHNLQAVAELCDRALFMNHECKHLGPVSETLREYIASATEKQQAFAGRGVEIIRAELNGPSVPSATITPGELMTLRVFMNVKERIDDLTLGFILYRSNDNLIVYEGNVRDTEVGLVANSVGETIQAEFRFRANLTRGQYHIECYALHNPTHEYLSRLCPAGIFSVYENVTCRGVADLNLSVEILDAGLPAPMGSMAQSAAGEGSVRGRTAPEVLK